MFVLTPSSGVAKVVVPRSCTATHGIKTCAFSYTRHAVKWLVPKGVTAVTVTVYGAQGGASPNNGTGGLGGEATANLAVVAGSALQVDVGGAGSGGTGGWNGGGNAGAVSAGDAGSVSTGGGGGGASDVRIGKCTAKLTCTMSHAALVAGGGGGGGDATYDPSNTDFAGGPGGGLSGGSAPSGGGGGTQTTGGSGGYNGECSGGSKGALGQGGGGGAAAYSPTGSCEGGAGGGGGYYGGGGSGSGEVVAEAGGGGSGSGPAHSIRATFMSGVRTGNGSVSISWPVLKKAATITSGASAHFPTGTTSSLTVTTGSTEWPIPKLKVNGSLPAGVTFVDKHDGTATLAGKPGASVAGSHSFQIVASNGVAPTATQKFTLTVGAAPQITSSTPVNWSLNSPGSFTVTTSGDPAPATITETGALPHGVTFTNNGDGTATFSGTPDEASGPVIGAYPITLKAAQPGGSSWPTATQPVTVYVGSSNQYVGFTVNATGTDSTALNPGIGLAVNGTACYEKTSGTFSYPWCAGGTGFENYFDFTQISTSRACDGIDLPLATSTSVASCFLYYITWDPADNVTLTAPATTTAGPVTYAFAFWGTSDQSVACNGGDINPACTFEVPPGGVNVTAVYVPLP